MKTPCDPSRSPKGITPDHERLADRIMDFVEELQRSRLVGAFSIQVLTVRNGKPVVQTTIRAREHFAPTPDHLCDAFVDGIEDIRRRGSLTTFANLKLHS